MAVMESSIAWRISLSRLQITKRKKNQNILHFKPDSHRIRYRWLRYEKKVKKRRADETGDSPPGGSNSPRKRIKMPSGTPGGLALDSAAMARLSRNGGEDGSDNESESESEGEMNGGGVDGGRGGGASSGGNSRDVVVGEGKHTCQRLSNVTDFGEK